MKFENKTEDVLVIRTDFSNENVWETICNEIQTPEETLGFLAFVELYSDKIFDQMTTDHLIESIPSSYNHSFIFIVDKITTLDNEHPVLCVDLSAEKAKPFRVIPSAMWCVENNLSTANMDYYEFLDSVDHDGVFRGTI